MGYGIIEQWSIFSVSCGICDVDAGGFEAESRKNMAEIVREIGWRRRNKNGWLCPFCAAPRKTKQSRLVALYQAHICDRRGWPNRNPESSSFKLEFAAALKLRESAAP